MSLAEELLADLGTPLSTIKRLAVWYRINLKGLCHDMNFFLRLVVNNILDNLGNFSSSKKKVKGVFCC